MINNDQYKISSLIYKVHMSLKSQLQNALKDFNLTTEQWIILRKVYKKSGKINQSDIAKETEKDKASVTRTLKILEKKNLIERVCSEIDRREQIIFITKNGATLYEKTTDKVADQENSVNAKLSDEDRKALERILVQFYCDLKKDNSI